jgi:hypothetical protein
LLIVCQALSNHAPGEESEQDDQAQKYGFTLRRSHIHYPLL